jgi:hypothetical protein
MKKIFAKEGAILIPKNTLTNVISFEGAEEIIVTDEEVEKVKKNPKSYLMAYDKIVKEKVAEKQKEKQIS